MLTESKNLEIQIESLNAKIRTFPDGKLICARNGKQYKWYQGNGSKYNYIPKSNRVLAEQLAAKKYLSLLSEDLSHEKKAIDFYLRHHKNDGQSEQLIHRTISNHLVRSKSEAIIDTVLHINQIPFRYECALVIGQTTLYPDFTIRHPATGAFFYWEHFGLMDDPVYSKNACSKLQLYTSKGIIPSIHLITTYETKDNPLNVDLIEKIIKYYFL